MKSRSESLIRLKKFQVDEKRRQVAQIEMMISDFERMASDLDQVFTRFYGPSCSDWRSDF